MRAGEPNPTRPDPRVGARVRRPRRPPSPPSEDDTGGKRTKRNITHPNPTRRRDDASSTPRSIADRSIADRSRTDRVIITRETPGEGWFVSSSNDGRDARATARSSSLPSPTARGEKMTRIGRRHRNEPSSSRVVGHRARRRRGFPPSPMMVMMVMMGLSRNPRRELYTPSPSSVVRGSLSSVFPSNSSPSRGRGLIVARSRSHAPSSALYVYGSVARPRRRDRDRSSDPSIRHPSDPSDLSIHPSDLTDPKIGSCRPVYCIVLCTSTM